MDTQTQEQLVDVYDVHYKNKLTNGGWNRWISSPKRDIQACYTWIKAYNQTVTIGNLIHIPKEEDCKTKFRIIRMVRTIVETI